MTADASAESAGDRPATPPFHDILISTDGSEDAVPVARDAIELAAREGATVHLLHVIDNNLLRAAVSPRSVKRRATGDRRFAADDVERIRRIAEERNVPVESWALRSRPYILGGGQQEVIVEYAEAHDCDLIVVGENDAGLLGTLTPGLVGRVADATDRPVVGRDGIARLVDGSGGDDRDGSTE